MKRTLVLIVMVLVVLLVQVNQISSRNLTFDNPSTNDIEIENANVAGTPVHNPFVQSSSGMPGWPIPDKPIPHHEPGHLSRAGSYHTEVAQANELGMMETVQVAGVDAMAADSVDPLAGNYTLVDWNKILLGVYDDGQLSLKTHNFISPTLSTIPNSDFLINNRRYDIAAGDLNGDGQAEQIAAWLGNDNQVYLSYGEMPGSLGKTTSTPAAVAHPDGSLDLVVRGYDDALWLQQYEGSSWSDWHDNAGGFLLSGPAIASQGNGRSTAFAIGTDNQVYRTSPGSRALEFDGVDDYVDLPDNFLNEAEFTFAAWVYWHGGDVWQRIFDFGQDANSYLFLSPSNGSNMRFAITTGSGPAEEQLSTSVLPTDQWVHVAVTLDGTTGVLYVNGSVVDTQPISLTPQEVIGANTWLGKSQYSADPNFNGILDEVAVFNRALSGPEIEAIYQSGWDSMSDKILGLHLDENPAVDGTILADVSGQGNNGTLHTSDDSVNKSVAKWQPVEPTGEWSPVEVWRGSTPELPAPAAVARNGQLDLFRLGPDNTLRWQHSDDGVIWQPWQNLGGMLSSGPGAISLGADRMQVFARGADDALWSLIFSNGDWGEWQRIEGLDDGVTIDSMPTAVSPGVGQIRVYVRGSDNKPYWIDYDGGSWGDWMQGDGALASGLGAAWLNDHYELFAQKSDGSLQQSSNGTAWNEWGGLPPIPPRTQNVATGLTGYPWPEDADDRSNYHDFSLDIETGYFSGDDRQQIALAYHNQAQGTTGSNLIGLALWDPWDPMPQTIAHDPLSDWSCDQGWARVVNITTGNFDGEGRDEIAAVFVCGIWGNATYQVKIYSVEPAAAESGGGYIVNEIAQSSLETVEPNSYFISIEIESGDFDGNGDDEIIVGSSWYHYGNYEDHIQAYRVYDYAANQLSNITPLQGNKFYIKTVGRCWGQDRCTCNGLPFPYSWCPRGEYFWLEQGLDLAVGNFDRNPADDEFVTLLSAAGTVNYGEGDYGDAARYLLVYDYDGSQWLVNGDDENEFHNWDYPSDPIPPIRGPWSNRDRLAVGDLDRDTVDEVSYYNGASSELSVYKLNLYDPSEWFNLPPAAVEPISNLIAPNINMVTGDFTGESIRVGPPAYRVQNRVDTLVSVINMPPKHQDLIQDANGEYQLIQSPVGECDPSPDSPNCTHAKFARQDYESSEQTIQTDHAYELSAGRENEICAGGGLEGVAEVKACAKTSIEATHGVRFEKSTEEIQSIGFRRKVIAANDDKIVFFGTPYGVWEYPVLSDATGEPAEGVFITVAFPLISVTQYPDSSGGYYGGTCDETWFTAGHQPNNVWSYDPIGDISFPDYNPDYEPAYDVLEADWAEGEITYEHLESAFHSVAFNHAISARAEVETSAEASLGVVDVSSNFKAYVQGDYSNSFLNTDTLTISQNTTFSYFLAPQPDNAKFLTRILLYRGKDDSQIINYQAEPGRSASWQLYDKPDPAFILPWYGFPNPDDPQLPPCGEEQKLFSPDVVINPRYASLGETVTISATVRNFSDVPVSNVRVRFYQGVPGDTNFIGDAVIAHLERVNGPQTVSISWDAAGVGQQKIYAVIDPNDEIDEMHEAGDLINNNLAYGLIQLGAAAYADMGQPAKQPYDPISYTLGITRPAVSLYVPRSSLSAVARFEVGGAEVNGIDEASPGHITFAVDAYQGSKYKLWDEPINNFNLKPEADDPPAVITVAYTDADVADQSETDLTLYRLSGAGWVAAACAGYETIRFPEDNIIAVPVCQTGVFVLSTQLPEYDTFLPLVLTSTP